MSKQTIFSGAQPTGNLHIGNYLGAVKNWVELQKEYQSIFCVVDHHALTIRQQPEELRKNILELAAIYLAAGIDPEKSIIFIQSHVKEHTELAWILNCFTMMGEAERMTQYKDKSQQHQSNINVGLFSYPILMAADILLYKTKVVPVGEDQKQHVEITRTIAKRFNNLYGETFIAPESLIKKDGGKIMGLDDPTKKMSKSATNSANYVALADDEKTILKKIKSAVTDSGSEVKFDEKEKPAISNLLTIYSALSGKSIKNLEKEYAGKGYGDFKKDLAEVVVDFLVPFQERYNKLASDKKELLKILEHGAEQAREIAAKTMKEVKERVGLI